MGHLLARSIYYKTPLHARAHAHTHARARALRSSYYQQYHDFRVRKQLSTFVRDDDSSSSMTTIRLRQRNGFVFVDNDDSSSSSTKIHLCRRQRLVFVNYLETTPQTKQCQSPYPYHRKRLEKTNSHKTPDTFFQDQTEGNTSTQCSMNCGCSSVNISSTSRESDCSRKKSEFTSMQFQL